MKIGFIGCGNMASAMIGGIIKSKIVDPKDILGADLYKPSLEKVKENFEIKISDDNKEVAKNSNVLFLSVKPQFYESVIKEISSSINDETLIVTIAPGQTIEKLEKLFDRPVHLIRTMPNTPALVKEGMAAMCPNSLASEKQIEICKSIFSSFGRVEIVEEYMMDAVTAISGSSPAYVFMMIEAMADAGVLKGLPRAKAYTFAAQAVLGSAKMLLELGKHPGELKDMVTSPAGTTIEACKVLEDEGFRGAIIDACVACADKSAEL